MNESILSTPKWEVIQQDEHEYTQRLPVFGGWIVQHVALDIDEEGKPVSNATGIVFVPDPVHDWGYSPIRNREG